jgi:hypothetical protein
MSSTAQYRSEERKVVRENARDSVEEGLASAKKDLIKILSAMEGLGNLKKFRKLNVIISKLESLQHDIS